METEKTWSEKEQKNLESKVSQKPKEILFSRGRLYHRLISSERQQTSHFSPSSLFVSPKEGKKKKAKKHL